MTSTTAADLRGVSRLLIDAVAGVSGIVEEMHRNIAGVAPIVGASPSGRARGISGLVYRSVRGVTRAIGFALDRHEHAALTLPFPASHQYLCYGADHFDLLNSREVCDRIRRWLAKGRRAPPTAP